MDEVKEMKEWMIENEDGTMTVQTKKGDYILEEVSEKVIESVGKMSEKIGRSVVALLVPKTVKEPKLTDDDFGDLPSSVSSRLKYATMVVNGVLDFL